MLGRLRMDVETAIRHYGTLVKHVFSHSKGRPGVRYAGRSRFDLIASDGGTKTARAATPPNTQIEGFSLYKTVY